MEPQDITNALDFFWQHRDRLRERAELEDVIDTLWILRGGTYNATLDWFCERQKQTGLDWRATARIVLAELGIPQVK